MPSNRERLIEAGLFRPLRENVIYYRERLLDRIAEGEKVYVPPVYCVYRADDPFSSIYPEDKKRCKEAELISDKLTSYEAHALCDRLNNRDPEQPRGKQHLPPLGMYRICHVSEWEAWEQNQEQIRFWGE